MDREKIIDALWERSGHGTQREDVVAAFEAGVKWSRERFAAACMEVLGAQQPEGGVTAP